MTSPHGGALVDLLARDEEKAAAVARAGSARHRLTLSPRQLNDVEMLTIGAYSPLRGFMGEADYKSVVATMRLANGLPWSIPITLAAAKTDVVAMRPGDDVALADATGQVVAVLALSELYSYDKEHEAQQVYRTTEVAHPGVAAVYEQGDTLLAGEITTLVRPGDQAFECYRLDPAQSRDVFAERGWKTVVGFQTRNPIHRAHEYIQKCALELIDGLFVHPVVGETKAGDIPADVRFRCYEALLSNYYPANRTILAINPAAMRYAGPREAIFHALIRKNYGCSHFIVGRDHAGVGNYYGTYDAQHIFGEFEPDELGITPLFFEHTFFCRACGNMASPKTCPHPTTEHIVLSGTKVRAMLVAGETPPVEFTRPEVAQILIDAAREEARQPA